jgi:acyl carrier protein
MSTPTNAMKPMPRPAAGEGLTEQGVLDRLRSLITEVTGVPPQEIAMESVFMTDLGAESIDLLDLSFLVEEQFGITLEPNEFESRARARIPGGVFEKDGCLTEEALAELRRLMPEVDPRRLVPGLRRADLPVVLTVGVFVHLIQRKMAAKAEGESHA